MRVLGLPHQELLEKLMHNRCLLSARVRHDVMVADIVKTLDGVDGPVAFRTAEEGDTLRLGSDVWYVSVVD